MIKLTKEQEDTLLSDRDEIPIVGVKKKWMPTLRWKEDALILHAIPKVELMNSAKTTALASFAIDFSVAEKFGFVVKTLAEGVQVGTQFTIHSPRHHLHGLDRTCRPLDAINL